MLASGLVLLLDMFGFCAAMIGKHSVEFGGGGELGFDISQQIQTNTYYTNSHAFYATAKETS
jgi:hypothetical protein